VDTQTQRIQAVWESLDALAAETGQVDIVREMVRRNRELMLLYTDLAAQARAIVTQQQAKTAQAASRERAAASAQSA
jgi:hypothetical protein